MQTFAFIKPSYKPLDYYTLCQKQLAPSNQPLHHLPHTYYVDASSASLPPMLQRPAQSSLQRIERFRHFWNEQIVSSKPDAIVEITGRDATESITVFNNLYFGSQAQYVFLKSPPKTMAHAADFSKITYVTGTCLLSDLRITLKDGTVHTASSLGRGIYTIQTPVSSIAAGAKLTFYEYESCLRLSSLLIALVRSRPHIQQIITLLVPRGEYYLFFAGALGKGLISKDTFVRWMDMVDARRNLIVQFIKQRIGTHLPNVVITEAPSSQYIAAYIRNHIAQAKSIQPDTLSNHLSQRDFLWKFAIDHQPQALQFENIGTLSYIIEELRAGYGSSPQQNLGIAIKNHPERQVLRRAEKLAKHIHSAHPEAYFCMMGLFPFGQILTLTGRSNLYWHEPGRYATSKSGVCDLFAIADELYAL